MIAHTHKKKLNGIAEGKPATQHANWNVVVFLCVVYEYTFVLSNM